MNKEEAAVTLIMVVGALGVMVIPACVGIIWKVYSDSKRATEANTLAINSLTTKIEILWAMGLEIPKLKQDVNAAHLKIRESRGQSE